ncbi:9209_t:CDS:2, partial [Diversispora eburnea]
ILSVLKIHKNNLPNEAIASVCEKLSEVWTIKKVRREPTRTTISEELAERKINNLIAEYFNVLDIQEVILCIKDLPKEYHSKMVSSFVNNILENKQDDVPVTIEFLKDICVDAPKSYTFTGEVTEMLTFIK